MNKNYTPEKRKEYNRKYYAEKKHLIHEKLYTIVPCNLCGMEVQYQYLPRHQKTKICRNHQPIYCSELVELRREIEKLKANNITDNVVLSEKPREDNKEKQ
jgi:hypothetical protein